MRRRVKNTYRTRIVTTMERNEEKPLSGTVAHIFSISTHLLLIIPVLYNVIIMLQKYSFFTWHPVCMVVGVGLFLMEAVFSISGESYLSSKVSRNGRVTIHWILHLLEMGLLIIGFLVVLINRIRLDKGHFLTPHSKLGLTAIILSILVALFGILAKNTRYIYPRIRPIVVKICHSFFGICAIILLLASLITGFYKSWWPGTDLGRSLVIACFVVAGFFVLIKPTFAVISKSRFIWLGSSRT